MLKKLIYALFIFLLGCSSVPEKYSGTVSPITTPTNLYHSPFSGAEKTEMSIAVTTPLTSNTFQSSSKLYCNVSTVKFGENLSQTRSCKIDNSPATETATLTITKEGKILSVGGLNLQDNDEKKKGLADVILKSGINTINNPIQTGGMSFQEKIEIPIENDSIELNINAITRGWVVFDNRDAFISDIIINSSGKTKNKHLSFFASGAGYVIRDKKTLAALATFTKIKANVVTNNIPIEITMTTRGETKISTSHQPRTIISTPLKGDKHYLQILGKNMQTVTTEIETPSGKICANLASATKNNSLSVSCSTAKSILGQSYRSKIYARALGASFQISSTTASNCEETIRLAPSVVGAIDITSPCRFD